MDHGPGEHDIDIKFVQADLPNKADMFNLDAQPRGVDGASLLRGEAERAVIRRCGSKRGVRQGYFRTRRREAGEVPAVASQKSAVPPKALLG